jgi:hypothetical protein
VDDPPNVGGTDVHAGPVRLRRAPRVLAATATAPQEQRREGRGLQPV